VGCWEEGKGGGEKEGGKRERGEGRRKKGRRKEGGGKKERGEGIEHSFCGAREVQTFIHLF